MVLLLCAVVTNVAVCFVHELLRAVVWCGVCVVLSLCACLCLIVCGVRNRLCDVVCVFVCCL